MILVIVSFVKSDQQFYMVTPPSYSTITYLHLLQNALSFICYIPKRHYSFSIFSPRIAKIPGHDRRQTMFSAVMYKFSTYYRPSTNLLKDEWKTEKRIQDCKIWNLHRV